MDVGAEDLAAGEARMILAKPSMERVTMALPTAVEVNGRRRSPSP